MSEFDYQASCKVEREALAKAVEPKYKRVLAEFSAIFSCSKADNISAFSGQSEAEMCLRVASMRVYRLLGQPSVFVGTFLKTNLLFLTILVFYCTYHTCSSPERLAQVWLGPLLLGACLPAILTFTALLVIITLGLWLVEKPKRLKLMPSSMVLRVQLSDELFAEFTIPWATVDSVKLVRHGRFRPEKELFIVIKSALGTNYSLRYDDMLTDNSEASFLNAVSTWAPQARASLLSFCQKDQLDFTAGANDFLKSNQVFNQLSSQAPQFTELWLHQFSTANIRQRQGILAKGTALKGNQYIVHGVLGGGGQGNAYLASRAVIDGEAVVLKEYIMPVYQGSSVLQKLTEKLQREAEILARLDHAGIVKLYDCFVEDYRGYLVLEYAHGRSLKELVQAEGAQNEKFVRHIATQLCAVLTYLHDFYPPIVHRDLTPDNIMLDGDSRVKVVDFNVARQLENASGATVVGKHAYIPPEQFRGRPSIQSDIYALGATLFYLLTGEEPEPLSQSWPTKVTPALAELVARATALELSQRYDSAGELLQDLLRLDEGQIHI